MFDPTIQLSDFLGGINTKQRPSKIKGNELTSIISMDFVANSLQRALGYSKFGIETDVGLVGKTLYTHKILSGTDLLVKSIGTFLKYYDVTDGRWYKITVSAFTAGYRWSFDTFNSFLYGNNGIDNWVYWNAATMSAILNPITAASTTIELPTGKGAAYPNSGSVMIQDEEITYSGKSTDQLTGCSVANNHPAGATVFLELDSSTYHTLAQARRVAFFRNRMYMIDYVNPNIIRHSKLADNTNPETDLVNFTIAGSGSGDAGFGIAPTEVVSIIPLINGNQSAVLMAFCKDGNTYAFTVTDGASTTVNAFVPMRTMNSYPAAPHMVTVVENDVAFADQLGHIRTLSFGDINTPLNVQTISEKIEPSLEAMDFSDGAIAYWKRKLRVGGKTTNAGTNNLHFYHDANYNAWGSYGHLDVVDYAIYNDELYGLSTITGNVWKMEDGYDANGNTYYSEFVTKAIDGGDPVSYKQCLKVRLDGYITSNCPLYLDFFFDDSEQPITFLISGDNTSILGPTPNVSVGSVVFGSGVWGGGLPNGVNRKIFVAELLLNDLVPFFKLSIRGRVDSMNVDFEIQDMVLWVKKDATELWIVAKTLSVN